MLIIPYQRVIRALVLVDPSSSREIYNFASLVDSSLQPLPLSLPRNHENTTVLLSVLQGKYEILI